MFATLFALIDFSCQNDCHSEGLYDDGPFEGLCTNTGVPLWLNRMYEKDACLYRGIDPETLSVVCLTSVG